MSEMNTAGELAALLEMLPADTPVIVRADGERDRIDAYVSDDGTLYLEGFSA